MNKQIGKIAIAQIAKQEGISENAVREKMLHAMMEGYENAETRQEWHKIFGENRIPSPDEFIATIGELVAKKIKL